MNANLTISEIITIAFILLLVFGPQRLPEMARKAGEWLGKLRTAAASIRDEFTAEYEEIAKPLTELDAEIKAVRDEVSTALPDMEPITKGLDEALESGVTSEEAGTEPDEDGNGAAPGDGDGLDAELAAARDAVRHELADTPSGNGAVDPFDAELTAAREEARAEMDAESEQLEADESERS